MSGTGANPVVVWADGRLVDPAGSHISWADHGLTVGDGVFETVKLQGGAPFALAAHLDRLEASARGMLMAPPDRRTLEEACSSVAREWERLAGAGATARLRITVTTGAAPAGSERGEGEATVLVTASPMTLTREPTAVVVVPWTRNERGALAGLKTTSYGENVVALAHARSRGASEAIFANTRGELCEGTGTNVFLARDGVLATPPLGSGCLDGITRSLLIDALGDAGIEVDTAPLPLEALAAADEAFLTSTGREVQPIARVDGGLLSRAPGPLTAAAMQAWDTAYGSNSTAYGSNSTAYGSNAGSA
ncbi:MAG: aminotransferase class IV [Microthrixaceae bacterium]|nr:aminotransferase class IV [Microthrixaceae bacterium]